jgi:hypothetical protein
MENSGNSRLLTEPSIRQQTHKYDSGHLEKNNGSQHVAAIRYKELMP